jgi:alkanesulfonate monooxygenase SsuD/methylene tetrahydromethanopterin reductase-like flavin-dependent oxidoreductase (luciferase family)
LETAAKNIGLPTQIVLDERYQIADEYLTLAYKLWESSWRDDAVVKDPETKQYTSTRFQVELGALTTKGK